MAKLPPSMFPESKPEDRGVDTLTDIYTQTPEGVLSTSIDHN